MAAIPITTFSVVFFVLTFVAWRRYLCAAEKGPRGQVDEPGPELRRLLRPHSGASPSLYVRYVTDPSQSNTFSSPTKLTNRQPSSVRVRTSVERPTAVSRSPSLYSVMVVWK